MSLFESSSQRPAEQAVDTERKEWLLRGAAVGFIFLLLWLGSLERSGAAFLFLAPLITGTLVTALRISGASTAVDSVERWLERGSVKATAQEGKFARFFKRPFFAVGRAIWRSTLPINDVHVRAGVRVTALIFLSALAVTLLVMAAYIVLAVVVLILMILFIGWIFTLSGTSAGRTAARTVRVTRYASDWLGRKKEEHYDEAGKKIGESRHDTDWMGRPKIVHADADGNKIGESATETDWMGNPKTVHKDADGRKVGESRPDTDWLGGARTIHTDAEGHVIGESREEIGPLGERKSVQK